MFVTPTRPLVRTKNGIVTSGKSLIFVTTCRVVMTLGVMLKTVRHVSEVMVTDIVIGMLRTTSVRKDLTRISTGLNLGWVDAACDSVN